MRDKQRRKVNKNKRETALLLVNRNSVELGFGLGVDPLRSRWLGESPERSMQQSGPCWSVQHRFAPLICTTCGPLSSPARQPRTASSSLSCPLLAGYRTTAVTPTRLSSPTMTTLPSTPPTEPPPPPPSNDASPHRSFVPSITTSTIPRPRPGPGGDGSGLSRPHRCNAQLSDIINGIFDAPGSLGTPLRAFVRCLRSNPGDPEYNVAGVEILGAPPQAAVASAAAAPEGAVADETGRLDGGGVVTTPDAERRVLTEERESKGRDEPVWKDTWVANEGEGERN